MANKNAEAGTSLTEAEELDSFDLDDLEAALQRGVDEQLDELKFMEEEKKQIGSPDNLGKVIQGVIWDQFINQVAVTAGEDFIKENRGLTLDLRSKAHIIDPDRFEKGELPEHNFENIEKYKKRFDETRADFQTDPNMEVKMSSNMRYDENTKTYERYDKKSGKWVGKTRYNEETKIWEDYNLRNGKWQKKLAKDARKNFDTRTKNEKGTKTVNKDHVISAAEQMRDNEAAAYMDRDERQKFAKNDVNIQDLDSAANQSKSDLSTEEWLNEPREDGQKQADYFGLDEDELRENDKNARKAYDEEKGKAKERVINEGRKSQKAEAFRIGGKALRAAVMTLLADLMKSIIAKLVSWFRSAERTLKSLGNSIKDAIHSFIVNLKERVLNVANVVVSTIVTAIVGPVFATIKKAWIIIKQGGKSLKNAIDYLRNPVNKGKPIGRLLMETGKIIIAGLSGVGAIVLGDVIEKALLVIPGFGIEIPLIGSLANILGIFLSAVISGIIGAISINAIEKKIEEDLKRENGAQHFEKANDVIVKQHELLEVSKEKLRRTVKENTEIIKQRHYEAGEIVSTSVENILSNSTVDEETNERLDKVDDLLNELEEDL